jgi:glyoxylase-like metal-dependent hydrolase (beta-lactamase superfamily II)
MKIWLRFFTFVFLLILASPSFAGDHHNENFALEDVKFVKINNRLTMMQAGGGNIAVMEGDDELFVVDSSLSDKREIIAQAIEKISKKPVRYLVNTHWHFDHTGNNLVFGEAQATILAHENVRTRLKEGGIVKAFDKKIEPAEKQALPVITYTEGVTLYVDDEAVKIIKIDNAHTDGDSIIFWKDSNVVHTGDLFFNGIFPFIDSSSGGTLKGTIMGVDTILSMIDDQTKIIPGHGPLANKNDLKKFHHMLMIVDGYLQTYKKENKTKEEWLTDNPLKDLEAEWANGMFDLKTFTNFIWDAP